MVRTAGGGPDRRVPETTGNSFRKPADFPNAPAPGWWNCVLYPGKLLATPGAVNVSGGPFRVTGETWRMARTFRFIHRDDTGGTTAGQPVARRARRKIYWPTPVTFTRLE
ncbi:hypothetical protein GCM10009716_15010 [Streptomyces sodiiphilus]|uniref:Uncharacterized protein n=1 Tax=Streptomyces sodiiphilus TaxID=226217 RepID=A0ABN2P0P3_9ACTN